MNASSLTTPADSSLISPAAPIAFIGGGNMARAIVGGLRRSGVPGEAILVVDPGQAQRDELRAAFQVRTAAEADEGLGSAAVLVWAIKPQAFVSAVPAYRPFISQALQLSVMAGIPSSAVARATGTERVVRAMPNTPALIGQGMAGLFARDAVSTEERAQVESVLASTGQLIWVPAEDDLEALTAVSGSGPAYVFYIIEAMIDAAQQMGLSADQGRQLTLATLAGSTALAAASSDAPERLRAQVTSKGGATHAAIESLERSGVKAAFLLAMQAAQQRARELGDEFSGA